MSSAFHATRSLSPSRRHSHRHNPSPRSCGSSSRPSPCADTLVVGMLFSKINLLAHLRVAPCPDLHGTKLAPGKEKEPLESQYQVGPLLRHLCGPWPTSTWKDRISDCGELPNGT